MALNANNFASFMLRVWDGRAGTIDDEDATRVATRHGATRVREFKADVWRLAPGDMPASLWRFRDGSEYVIGDDGSWIRAARRPGHRAYNEKTQENVSD